MFNLDNIQTPGKIIKNTYKTHHFKITPLSILVNLINLFVMYKNIFQWGLTMLLSLNCYSCNRI